MRITIPFNSLIAGLLGVLLAGTACNAPTSVPSPPVAATPGDDVIVTVNGTPIRVADLHFTLARADRGKGKGAEEARAKAALEKIIDEELARQRAKELGLDRTPEYLRRLRFMEAPLKDFQRYALSEALIEQEILGKAKPSEKEARAYFEGNRERFATRFLLQQILVRGNETKVQALKASLDAGKSFDEVAAGLFSRGLEPGKRPWTLNELPWSKIPEPWQRSLETMKEGETSEILRGPKARAWIIKVLKRRIDASLTFEEARTEVIAFLTAARIETLGKTMTQELREGASVNYLRSPRDMPPPPEHDE